MSCCTSSHSTLRVLYHRCGLSNSYFSIVYERVLRGRPPSTGYLLASQLLARVPCRLLRPASAVGQRSIAASVVTYEDRTLTFILRFGSVRRLYGGLMRIWLALSKGRRLSTTRIKLFKIQFFNQLSSIGVLNGAVKMSAGRE